MHNVSNTSDNDSNEIMPITKPQAGQIKTEDKHDEPLRQHPSTQRDRQSNNHVTCTLIHTHTGERKRWVLISSHARK